MIGMTLTIPGTAITGEVDAEAGTADGRLLVRIQDRWFLADELGWMTPYAGAAGNLKATRRV